MNQNKDYDAEFEVFERKPKARAAKRAEDDEPKKRAEEKAKADAMAKEKADALAKANAEANELFKEAMKMKEEAEALAAKEEYDRSVKEIRAYAGNNMDLQQKLAKQRGIKMP